MDPAPATAREPPRQVLRTLAPNTLPSSSSSAAAVFETITTTCTATTSSSSRPGIKRSRSSDLDLLHLPSASAPSPPPAAPPPFPERAGQNRKPKLNIDVSRLPKLGRRVAALEVDVGCHRELFRQELKYAADADYFSRQSSLKPRMRAVLMDWMFEVSQEYGLKRDSVHAAVAFVDLFLSRNVVDCTRLQLLGVTALWMGSKMEEILPPPLSDFTLATNEGCRAEDMIRTELDISRCLDWNLMPCTAYSFVSAFLQRLIANRQATLSSPSTAAAQGGKAWMSTSVVPHTQLNRVMELVDLAVLDHESLCFLPSTMAATAILTLVLRDPASSFSSADVERATGIATAQLDDCMEWFAYAVDLKPNANGTPREHVLHFTPIQELHTIQRHNPHALEILKSHQQARGGLSRRSPPADRSWCAVRVRLAAASAAAAAAAGSKNNNNNNYHDYVEEEEKSSEAEDAELSAIAGSRTATPGLYSSALALAAATFGLVSGGGSSSIVDGRAYSPMTDLVNGLANTGVADNSQCRRPPPQ